MATSFSVSGNSITNLADGSVSGPSGASVVAGDVPAPTYALSLGGGNSGVEMGAKDLGVASNAATLECCPYPHSGETDARGSRSFLAYLGVLHADPDAGCVRGHEEDGDSGTGAGCRRRAREHDEQARRRGVGDELLRAVDHRS